MVAWMKVSYLYPHHTTGCVKHYQFKQINRVFILICNLNFTVLVCSVCVRWKWSVVRYPTAVMGEVVDLDNRGSGWSCFVQL